MGKAKNIMPVRVGTASFSDPEWKDGVVYPRGLKQQDILPYYEMELGFDCVEIDASYYAILGEKSYESMISKTGKGFIFTVKGYKGFTFDQFSPYEKTKPTPGKVKDNLDRFLSSVSPLVSAKKLGCVLLQFPVFFTPSKKNFDHLELCRERLKNLPLSVEFRNTGWAKQEAYDFLRKNNLGFCVVDGPRIPKLMPFVDELTSETGYLRLHGRNKDWFTLSKEERVDYKYSDDELKEIISGLKATMKKAEKFFVIFNNNFNGYAVKDAERFRELLGDMW